MADIEKYGNELMELADDIDEFRKRFNDAFGGSFKWGLKQVVAAHQSMFERFCPFKVGDRVELVKDTDVDNSSGWSNCKHFLKKGAKAIVRRRGYVDGYFTFHIEFEDESWIDRKGVEHPTPIKDRHLFHYSEDSLRKVEEVDND